ncbi:type II 3-dehydroquinate dehydratase [Calidifontibacter indicus]|uniref:type II 3-dehydroquinate dehydratase n=1 Tax=Calidifontibacter indicus TaxID=419650 RepID=UPI003D72DA69
MSDVLLVLNGPNLNLLGERDPEQYGRDTLADIEAAVRTRASSHGFEVDFRQSNYEGELISWIQEARGKVAGLVFNPAGYSHTSVAIADALDLLDAPIVEVHLSNIHKREPFRHHSYVSAVASGVIAGLGAHGYELAVDAVARLAGR